MKKGRGTDDGSTLEKYVAEDRLVLGYVGRGGAGALARLGVQHPCSGPRSPLPLAAGAVR